MIFCKSRKFIFLRVPKNASTSLSLQIQKNLDFQPGDFSTSFHGTPAIGNGVDTSEFYRYEHATIDEMLSFGIIDPAELESYSIYGVFRHPVDRFFSLFSFFLNTSWSDRRIDQSKLSKDELASIAFDILEGTKRDGQSHMYVYRKNNRLRRRSLKPQASWLMYNGGRLISNIVVYPKFDDMLISLTGSSELQFKEKQGSSFGKKPIDSPISESTLEGIRYWYAEDFDLWEKLGYNK